MAFKIVAITNRNLCEEALPERVAQLCEAGIDRVIVREKDLTEHAYAQLLDEIVCAVAPEYRKLITVNTFADVASKKGIVSVQLPLQELETHPDFIHEFAEIGVSTHSIVEVKRSQKLEATFALLGTIFPTACKPGHEGKGLDFLREACHKIGLPVYAIGGISLDNIAQVQAAGADGACLMSELMTCADVKAKIDALRARLQ